MIWPKVAPRIPPIFCSRSTKFWSESCDIQCPYSHSNLSPTGSTGATPPLVLSAVLASGSDVTGVRGQVDSGSAVAEAVGVTAGHVGFSSGKEKASPASRPAHSDPQAPDSESIIVAMERVSVLFDRYTHTLAHPPS